MRGGFFFFFFSAGVKWRFGWVGLAKGVFDDGSTPFTTIIYCKR